MAADFAENTSGMALYGYSEARCNFPSAEAVPAVHAFRRPGSDQTKDVRGRRRRRGSEEGADQTALPARTRRRLSERQVQGLEALFALRATAQQVDKCAQRTDRAYGGSAARYRSSVRSQHRC